MNRVTLLIGLCLCCLPVAKAQTTDLDPSGMLRQLLTMPAPTPRTADANAGTEETTKQRPLQFFDKDKAPPDDATIEDLLEYWERWADTSSRPDPSDAVRQRLLDACVADLEKLPRLLPLLSQSEAATRQVKELYDKAQSDQLLDENWRNKVREWLLFNSKYFLSDLVALANKAKDNNGGYVDKKDALSALARVDFPTAEPLLQSLSNSGQQRTATLALTLLYKQAISTKVPDAEEKYRGRLQAIAADKNAPASARDAAIDVLSLSEWSGRDDWYISLFSDDTLRECTDGIYLLSPLTTLFDRDPDKWIPVMFKLVESKDRAVQQAAASCFVLYAIEHPRRDAILPVLRWLSDPDWLDINGTERAWFIQTMDEIEIPESVPGLIWIVENEDNNRIWAARTLAHYMDPRAIPALKKALAAETGEDHRGYILEGLLASGGLSETEQVAGLEAYATKLTTPEGREEVERYRSYSDEPLPIPVSIGRFLATKKDVPDILARAVLARAERLKRKNAAVAQSLLEVAHRWQSRQVDLDLIHRIANGAADANTIAKALERRTDLRESLGSELQSLAGIVGSAQGIGAVLLTDPALAQSVLGAEDQAAQIALLACARLTQMPLPVDHVGALMESKNPLLALAAERYLLAEDSKEAQEFLWARHPNEAFITGWHEDSSNEVGRNSETIENDEEKLRAQLLKESAQTETFALLLRYEQRARVVRVYKNRAVYTDYENSARYRERVLTDSELANFKRFVSLNHLTELGPQLGYCHNNCAIYEFLSLTRQRGRRVFCHQGAQAWITMFAQFDLLGRGEGAKIHYNLEQAINGLEVLYADEILVLKDVWQQGADIRIFVEREQTPEEIEQWNRPDNSDDEEDAEAARAERRRQETARFNARFSWRALENIKAGKVMAQPAPYSTLDENRFDIDDNEFPSYLNEHLLLAAAGDVVVLARNFDGLWKKQGGQKPVRISGEGAYANPVTTPDGKWAIAAKTDSHWGVPNYVVRFNLQTGREYRVDLPPADEFEPVAYLAAHSKVLLRRAKDDNSLTLGKSVGPDLPEYYLLDVATGRTQLSPGVFTPLLQEGKRFLQSTGKPDEFWAAIPDRVKNQTQVGRYNLKDFSFQPLLTVPHISFDSMAMWVDEAGAKLYLVYDGQLLLLPLRNAQ